MASATALAQPPTPAIRTTFADALTRAIDNNPTVAVATAGILRAEGLLRQARAATLLQVTGNITTTTLNKAVEFSGSTVAPQNQVTFSATADMPIVAAAAWARRARAQDDLFIAALNRDQIRRQIAVATADAYLSVIGLKRVVEATVTARDVARAHYDLADQLEQAGRGSHLNSLRALQQVSSDEALVEQSNLAVYRAQEALGVLLVAGGPVDVIDVPTFAVPPDVAPIVQLPDPAPSLTTFRTDLKLFTAEQTAAERVLRDSSKEWWPTLDAVFVPQAIRPAPLFSFANSWRLMFEVNAPIFDSGFRSGTRTEHQSALNVATANLAGAMTDASSEVRDAREAVASGERVLASARAAADQANQVVNITNISFRAGAATNIEVTDAQRVARDVELAVAVAEDALLRARLDLLDALGRFP
jgi:outer membrane protein TolC